MPPGINSFLFWPLDEYPSQEYTPFLLVGDNHLINMHYFMLRICGPSLSDKRLYCLVKYSLCIIVVKTLSSRLSWPVSFISHHQSKVLLYTSWKYISIWIIFSYPFTPEGRHIVVLWWHKRHENEPKGISLYWCEPDPTVKVWVHWSMVEGQAKMITRVASEVISPKNKYIYTQRRLWMDEIPDQNGSPAASSERQPFIWGLTNL